MSSMLKVTKNAYKQYLKSRPAPSSESVKRIKNLDLTSVQVHPIFKGTNQVHIILYINHLIFVIKTLIYFYYLQK